MFMNKIEINSDLSSIIPSGEFSTFTQIPPHVLIFSSSGTFAFSKFHQTSFLIHPSSLPVGILHVLLDISPGKQIRLFFSPLLFRTESAIF